jgi:hypothetical protein
VVYIGDIGVSHRSVFTPAGVFPLKGTSWVVMDMTRTEKKIPTWAIVLAVVFAFLCLLGLLFLLAKEEITTGYVQVTVTGSGLHHATMILARDPSALQQVSHQVNWARSAAAAA